MKIVNSKNKMSSYFGALTLHNVIRVELKERKQESGTFVYTFRIVMKDDNAVEVTLFSFAKEPLVIDNVE